MNNDLISREALKEVLSDPLYRSTIKDYGEILKYTFVMDIIDNAPSIVVGYLTNCSHCDSGYAQGYSDGYLKGKEDTPHGEWITDRQPDKNGTYLCVVSLEGANVYFRDILSYATDLYEVDNFDFQKYRYKKKTDRAGWYYLDSEYGYIHYEDDEVVAWMELPELPEPYKGEEE